VAKTKLTKGKLEIARRFMFNKLVEDRKHILDEVRNAAVIVINKIFRKAYPEADMIVFRKYDLNRVDYCIRFNNNDSDSGFFILYVNQDSTLEELICDISSGLSCRTYPINSEERAVIEQYMKARDIEKTFLRKKNDVYVSFLQSCKTVEDVHKVVQFPTEVLNELLGPGKGALIAYNPDVLKEIQADFPYAA